MKKDDNDRSVFENDENSAAIEKPAESNLMWDSRPDNPDDEVDRFVRELVRGIRERYKEATFGEVAVVVTNGLLIILGFVAAIIYGGQLIEMQKANKVNGEALSAVQAAFVYLVQFRVGYNDPHNIMFLGEWRNSGNTPANQITQYLNVDWRNGPLPPGFDYKDKPPDDNINALKAPKNFYIAPHESANGTLLRVPRNILEQLVNGKESVHFYGWANYKDVFGCSHRTEFCYTVIGYDPHGKEVMMAACPEHVCADKECSDYRPENSQECLAP